MSNSTFSPAAPAGRLREVRDDDLALLETWHDQSGLPLRPREAADSRWVWVDADDRPLATVALRARLGLDLPRYSYHVGRVVHAATELGLFRVQTTLLMGNDHTGQGELLGLAGSPDLAPAQQVAALAALVQAVLPKASASAEPWWVVELQGWRDDAGSPFWRSLGARFYPGDPTAAEARHGPAWRSHLAALLPRQTLYLSFLSEMAQAQLGQPSVAAAAAFEALRLSGFQSSDHVRIDDGGPILAWRKPAEGA